MRKVYRAIEAVAGNANVVIRGESGVGKELVARAIVQSGERQRPALYLPELLGAAGEPDRVGIVRLREGCIHGRRQPRSQA